MELLWDDFSVDMKTVLWFLRVMWMAGMTPILVALMLPGSSQFRRIILSFANRGKTVSSSAKRFLVPQSYFMHFYIIGVLWTTSLLVFVCCCAVGGDISLEHTMQKIKFSKTKDLVRIWKIVLVLLLMEFQVLRRLYESIFVFSYRSSAKMHIVGYLIGLYFYAATPLSIFLVASQEVWHHMEMTPHIVGRCSSGLKFLGFVNPLTHFDWHQWIGAAVWFWGSLHQYRCHSILGSVRKQDGTEIYIIPREDWFEFVSCPHYLAEIVIYAGIVVFGGGSDPTMWLLFTFVVLNLALAAVETHKWYQQKFENYPSSRRAIFPLVL